MPAQLLDGSATAAAIRTEVAEGVAALRASAGVTPALANVMGESDPASRSYARSIQRAAERAGMGFRQVTLPPDIVDDDLRAILRDLGDDPKIHGVIVQAPLPKPLTQAAVFDALDPRKDVDGITPVSAGRLALNQPGFVPSTPAGGMELLRRFGLSVAGLKATVVGRSPVVGKPMALLLLNANATVTVCHTSTSEGDLREACRRADVLCAAVGRQPGFITQEMIKPGAIVIDFGTIPGPDGKLRGDIDFEGASAVAAWITPVPGGTGPMTAAMLLRQTLEAAQALAA
ncbi:MAG: bifunctional 5,10-methylenetetrahydrofolate dehydrogenase/5,10-methenyltetrahydrofolate cyclohydrolase [Chloroflexi bacterium]|nr:bifunctional 5,10-methylenetetrahydrofolate dehydrogenase/5,10-methenyltetrahydrofolate cyclohydrolase [Chloroflexota bacterium]